MDIYFSEEESNKAVEDIAADIVFKEMEQNNNADVVPTPSVIQTPPTNAFEQRRYYIGKSSAWSSFTDLFLPIGPSWWQWNKLLLSKNHWEETQGLTRRKSKMKCTGTLQGNLFWFIHINICSIRFLQLRGTVPTSSNPQSWWREHASEFVLLSWFYRAHSAFQATSTASERVFNVEGLIFTESRWVIF